MEHDLSKQYWNNRYLNNDFKWDIGYASPALVEYILHLINKNIKILIPGAGNSYEAEFLFKNGFKNVYVLDFAYQALQNFKNRFPEFPKEQLIQEDFFKHKGLYDIILEQTFFCAINPSLRKKYVSHTKSLLKPQGKLVGLFFDDALNTDMPPFGGSKAEYQQLFSPAYQIKQMDTCYNSIEPRKNRELFVILKKSNNIL